MVKHIAKIVLGEELYNIKDTEVRGDLNNHASNTDIHVTAAEKEYWNSKVNPPSYSAPTAKQLTYTGEAQDLLNPGSSTSGSIQYSTDEVNWSTTIPQATNAGTYTVYWKFAGSEIVYVDSTAINVTIAKANPTYTAPTAKTLTYNGSAQELVNAGSTDFGTLQYSLDDETYGTGVPSGTNAGSYTVYYKVVGDSNVNDVAAQSVSCSIGKGNRTVTISGNQTSMTLGQSNTITVSATGNPASSLISIASSNTAVATISETTVNAVGTGTTTVTVTVASDANYNSVSTSYSLSVTRSNGVYAAYADGSFRTVESADTNAIGVAVITDNCKFIMDKTSTELKWDSNVSTNQIIAGCTVAKSSTLACTDYSGISNTNAIVAVASGGEAAKYCRSCSKTIAGKTIYGYLGACGEWNIVYNNITAISSIMSIIGGNNLSRMYCSSTLYSTYSLFWCADAKYGMHSPDFKTAKNNTLAFYAIS